MFAVNTKLEIMAMLALKVFTTARKGSPPVGLDMMITGLRVSLTRSS